MCVSPSSSASVCTECMYIVPAVLKRASIYIHIYNFCRSPSTICATLLKTTLVAHIACSMSAGRHDPFLVVCREARLYDERSLLDNRRVHAASPSQGEGHSFRTCVEGATSNRAASMLAKIPCRGVCKQPSQGLSRYIALCSMAVHDPSEDEMRHLWGKGGMREK